MDMFGGFSSSKLKAQLKMAVSRIQISSNKKAALLKQSMREIAVMLSEDPPKEEKAKIRAEALIRDDNLIEAYQIIQLQCELISERIKLLEVSGSTCPADLVPVIATIIYASQRIDIPELMMARKQFRAKYGKKFEEAALVNKNGMLNERVVTKLSVDPPAAYLVQTYLERICEKFEVNWKPKYQLTAAEIAGPMAVPVGYSVPMAQGTGLGFVDIGYAKGGDEPPMVHATQVEPSMPPHAPGFGKSGNNGNNNNSQMNNNNIKDNTSSTTQHTKNNNNNNNNGGSGGGIQSSSSSQNGGEAEYYIPPSAPMGYPGQSPSNTKTNDDDDDDNNAASNGGGGGNSADSYDDLLARFSQLKK